MSPLQRLGRGRPGLCAHLVSGTAVPYSALNRPTRHRATTIRAVVELERAALLATWLSHGVRFELSQGGSPMEYETDWRPWPLRSSAVWIGALAALPVGLIIGLVGYAVGAHQFTAPRTMTFKGIKLLTLAFSVGGAFFAFVVGGWAAARIADVRRAGPAILHGVFAGPVT